LESVVTRRYHRSEMAAATAGLPYTITSPEADTVKGGAKARDAFLSMVGLVVVDVGFDGCGGDRAGSGLRVGAVCREWR
jgi:hypothetical protein